MQTYRELVRAPGFPALFLSSAVHVAATTVAGLALGVLVFSTTGSPLLAALSMFGPSLVQVVGAATVLSAADRLPPRVTLTGLALTVGLATAAQALPGLPGWAVFALLLAQGFVASIGGGVRYGLLRELVPETGYLLGRSTLAMSTGLVQILGFAVGGVLVGVLSARGTLLVAAGLFLVAAAIARGGLDERPPRTTGRPSLAATRTANARLWSNGRRRTTLLGTWLPNGLVVGCESLFVPYAPEHAGALLAAASLGMLVGDTMVGRFVPLRLRAALPGPLLVLLAAPYLLFALDLPLPVAVAAAGIAGIGFGSTLLLVDRLMLRTPLELSGHALGLQNAGMLAMQGVGAGLAGTLAQLTTPATAIAGTAGASLVITAVLAVQWRRSDRRG